jgi:ABC-type nitrate/sulfonate/bicarbonate transport system substrate-binding protein
MSEVSPVTILRNGRRRPGVVSALLSAALLVACAGGAAAPSATAPAAPAGRADPASADTPAAAPRALEPITYVLPSVSGLFVPPVLAEDKGFFRDEGLAVTLPVMRPNMLAPALMAGEAEYAALGATAVRSALTGVPIRLTAALVDKSSRRLMALPTIQSIDQLKGQAIAVSTLADGPHNHALLALEYSGVDPNEMTWLAMGHSNERLLALQQGQVPASVFSGAEIPRAETLGLLTLLRFETVAPLPQAGMAVTTQKLETDRPQVKRVLRAVLRALHYLRTDRAGSLPVFQSYLGLSPEEAEAGYDAIAEGYSADGTLSERAMRVLIDGEQRLLGRSGEVRVSEVADFGPLLEVLAEQGMPIAPDTAR